VTGNLEVITDNTKILTYTALLTQTGVLTGTTIQDFNGGLILGETYTITDYVEGDDFSNLASGVQNQTGRTFTATGEQPANWQYGSTLTSSGNLVVNIIENTLGFDLIWYNNAYPGVYYAYRSDTGPIHNSFQKSRTSVQTSDSIFPLFGPPRYIKIYGGPGSFGGKDELIFVIPFDFEDYSNVQDSLYYTPVTIKMRKDENTTPIVINGSIIDSFPLGNTIINLTIGSTYIQTIRCDNYLYTENIEGLVQLLNQDPKSSYLGVFEINESGDIQIQMPTNIKNQFAEGSTLTFEIYNNPI
jgi:hypothetical protein